MFTKEDKGVVGADVAHIQPLGCGLAAQGTGPVSPFLLCACHCVSGGMSLLSVGGTSYRQCPASSLPLPITSNVGPQRSDFIF